MELLLSPHHVGRRVLLRCGTITLIIAYSPGGEFPVKTPLDNHRANGFIDMGKGYTLSGQTGFDILE